MTTTVNRNGFWTAPVWKCIDDAVTKAVMAIRVAQKVFYTVQLDASSVPSDEVDLERMTIEEGLTKPYVELAVEFSLTNGQVNSDPTGYTAITLSGFAAKSLALAEDMIILRGKEALQTLPATVRIESGAESLKKGILGLVPADRTIAVDLTDAGSARNSGDKILEAVSQGIALLSTDPKAPQGPPYYLIEDTNTFAATTGRLINCAPAYHVLKPLLMGGEIYGTGAMPVNTALLYAKNADPTIIYSGSDALTEPTGKTHPGRYAFRTFERVQFVARDPRAFVKFEFKHSSEPAPARKKDS